MTTRNLIAMVGALTVLVVVVVVAVEVFGSSAASHSGTGVQHSAPLTKVQQCEKDVLTYVVPMIEETLTQSTGTDTMPEAFQQMQVQYGARSMASHMTLTAWQEAMPEAYAHGAASGNTAAMVSVQRLCDQYPGELTDDYMDGY